MRVDMRLAAFFLFLISVEPSFSQVSQTGQASALAEEQDYAFAYGLFHDGLFQLAAEQFEKFLQKHPGSIKAIDASFLSIESRFQLQQFDTASKLFARFVTEHPSSRLTDDAYLRLGECLLRMKKSEEAIAPLKIVLDQFSESDLAGEAAYWIGEASVRLGDYENAVKYYTLSYEHFPNNRLRDYALYAVGWAYQTKGDYVKAVEWYPRVAREFPKSELVSASFVRRGECFYYTKEYRRAIDELTASAPHITREEEKGEAEYLIAEAYYHLAEYEKARTAYERFLADHAGHRLERDVVYALGWTYLKLNSHLQAEQSFNKLAEGSDALAHSALFRRGVAEKFGGKAQKALETWNEVVLRAPKGEYSDNALYESGLVLYEQDKAALARDFFARVIKEYTSSDVLADSYRMLGECYVTLNEFQKAKEEFAKAAAIPDASFDAKVNSAYQLAWSQFKLKQYPEAIQTFTQFLEDFKDHPKAVDARFWRAEAEYQTNRLEAAANDYLAVAAGKSGKREESLYGAGWSFYKLADFAKAKEQFSALVSAYPSGKFIFDARLRYADCAFFLKDYLEAGPSYRTVIRQFPEHESNDYAYYQLGQTLYRTGSFNEATLTFTDLMKRFPQSPLADDGQYAIGWIWFQNKQYLEAIKEFQTLLKSFPNSDLQARASYSIGDSYYNLQQYGPAEKAYREVLNRFPKSQYVADAISGIQYCLLAEGKQQEALRVIDTFIKENPDAEVAEALFLKKGDLLFSQHQYDAAIKEYKGFTEKYPGSSSVASAFYWIGKSYEAQDRFLDAAQSFERASLVANGNPKIVAQALLSLGESMLQLKSYEKALEALSKIENLSADKELAGEALLMKGQVFERQKKISEAHRQYNDLVARYPQSTPAAKASVALARIYLNEANYSEAMRIAEVVATTRTDDLGAEAQYVIGLCYEALREWPSAITAFLRVKYIFPAQEVWLARSYLGLGESYERTNEPRRAKDAYQTVVKMEAQKEEVAEAKRRLKRLEGS